MSINDFQTNTPHFGEHGLTKAEEIILLERELNDAQQECHELRELIDIVYELLDVTEKYSIDALHRGKVATIKNLVASRLSEIDKDEIPF